MPGLIMIIFYLLIVLLFLPDLGDGVGCLWDVKTGKLLKVGKLQQVLRQYLDDSNLARFSVDDGLTLADSVYKAAYQRNVETEDSNGTRRE